MNQPLPEQARKQLEEAERIEAELGLNPEDNPELTEPPPEPEPAPDAPAPEPEPAPPPEPEPEPEEVVAAVESDKWEERYKAIQGKYDAEVPRLNQQNQQLNTQVGDLNRKLDDLTEKLEKLTAKPDEPAPSLISEKDEENFGSDMIDLMRRVVREDVGALSHQLQGVVDEISTLKSQLTTVGNQTQQTHAEVFSSRLLELVPDWEAINGDKRWLEWLKEIDPFTGQQRQQQLNFAHAQLNAERVAKFFIAFKDSIAPPPADDPDPEPTPGPEEDLGSQITPSRSAANRQQQNLETEPRIWTEAEVQSALDPRKLKGMTPDAVTALMNEIDAAAAEGRVKPG